MGTWEGCTVHETVETRSPEGVVLSCLLDRADLVYPSTVAQHIVTALRDAGMLREPDDASE